MTTKVAGETTALRDRIAQELEEGAHTLVQLKEHARTIREMALAMIDTLERGGKIVLFGNGGSAADAQHLAAELVGKFQHARPGLPAIALTVNPSVLTAIGNDFAFEEIFARQVEALVTERDLVCGISTGGYSPSGGKFSKNVVRGIEEAKKKGARTVALLGKGGGLLATMVDIPLVVPSNNTQRIQEAHIAVGHILCSLIDRALTVNQDLPPPEEALRSRPSRGSRHRARTPREGVRRSERSPSPAASGASVGRRLPRNAGEMAKPEGGRPRRGGNLGFPPEG